MAYGGIRLVGDRVDRVANAHAVKQEWRMSGTADAPMNVFNCKHVTDAPINKERHVLLRVY